MKKEYEIDGNEFSTLQGFFDHISKVLVPGLVWGKNLDAFNEILSGGYGTPHGGFVLRWKHSNQSREELGYAETVRYLERKLKTCDPANRDKVRLELELARLGKGPTVFEILRALIEEHGPGGSAASDGVELMLL